MTPTRQQIRDAVGSLAALAKAERLQVAACDGIAARRRAMADAAGPATLALIDLEAADAAGRLAEIRDALAAARSIAQPDHITTKAAP